MRSSNYRHLKTEKTDINDIRNIKAVKVKKFSRIATLVVALVLGLSAVAVPSITWIQKVNAVTIDSEDFARTNSDTLRNTLMTEPVQPAEASDSEVADEPEEEETAEVEEEIEEVEVVEDEKDEEEEYEESSYSTGHIQLSDYDRELLEGLVMGEAGGYGYDASALVAQAVRDAMIESNTSSVEEIISSYGYEASTDNTPTSAVKQAVSFIFDEDGSAVDHRILYFYSADMVESEWHETQNFITQCGNMRFFDRAD